MFGEDLQDAQLVEFPFNDQQAVVSIGQQSLQPVKQGMAASMRAVAQPSGVGPNVVGVAETVLDPAEVQHPIQVGDADRRALDLQFGVVHLCPA